MNSCVCFFISYAAWALVKGLPEKDNIFWLEKENRMNIMLSVNLLKIMILFIKHKIKLLNILILHNLCIFDV